MATGVRPAPPPPDGGPADREPRARPHRRGGAGARWTRAGHRRHPRARSARAHAAGRLWLRTSRHPAAEVAAGAPTFDHVYEQADRLERGLPQDRRRAGGRGPGGGRRHDHLRGARVAGGGRANRGAAGRAGGGRPRPRGRDRAGPVVPGPGLGPPGGRPGGPRRAGGGRPTLRRGGRRPERAAAGGPVRLARTCCREVKLALDEGSTRPWPPTAGGRAPGAGHRPASASSRYRAPSWTDGSSPTT